ncbi:helix-turn-helix domain-containing protein [Massilia antarctica]|uniref:helix-turn-helix domain-containing protein n=1 Tax=Massilia antarctica TaxID=2765360 RepID=UPI0006BE1236|nr:helix-turn-helix domain-containing protein [Massilia sp. H27-R4]MCY0913766.1 DUF4115 domain-containing protein [Massilia sp. H27-R4]CUI04555.1 FIG021952: putative membrane protein [Janthinobacterium sp. CG23_2]CUU28341.1 FIG021952: putative membrane protein [Janthinobacterium sp. CG23_2]
MSSEWAEQTAAGANPGANGATNATVNHSLPGKTLAAQREAMGWTVEQVADQLKMAVRQVTALEAGDYANLPGPAVVRGFVRAYAKVVKLDAAPLVAMIALDTPELAEPGNSRTVRRDKPATFSEVRFPTNGKRSRLPLGLIGAAVLVVAAAAGAWHFGLVPTTLLSGSTPATAPAAAPATAGSQASVTVLPAPVVADKPAIAPLETTLVKPDERKPVIAAAPPLVSVLPPATAPAASAGATPVAAAPAAPPGSNTLVLNVRADSWVEVRRAKGAPLLSRLLKAGTVETVEVGEPVTLIVGKPDGVSATLRGDAVALPSNNGRVSRVNLK